MANIVKKLFTACLTPDGSPPASRQNTAGPNATVEPQHEPSAQQDLTDAETEKDPLSEPSGRQASTSSVLPVYEPQNGQDQNYSGQDVLYDEPEDVSAPVLTQSPTSPALDAPFCSSPTEEKNKSKADPGLTQSPTGSTDADAGPREATRPQPITRPSMLARLPSESLSTSSSSSSSSDSEEASRPSKGKGKRQSSDAREPKLNEAKPRQTSARPAPLSASSSQSEQSQYLSAAITPSTVTRSPMTPVTEPSTPTGFAKHRHSASQASAKGVRETLDAYMTDSGDDELNEHGVPARHHRSRRINQYRVGKLLGKGSAASVYLAQDDKGGLFACKEFSKSTLRRRKKSEMLRAKRGRRGGPELADLAQEEKDDPLILIRTEIAIMKKLHHPYLVQLYEVLDVPHDDCLFLMMELCRGGPLTSISVNPEAPTTATTVSEAQARNWFRQLMLAVEYLHENDVIHRDIKPENILFADEDHLVCKIVDFGVSEMFRSPHDDRSTKAVGSPAFMSPELLSDHRGSGIHGRPADLWALGVTLYCLCTGRLPFHSPNYLDLNDMILNDPVQIPSELSSPLQHMLSRVLDKNPETRITLDELREHDWITQYGETPMPSKEDNVEAIVEEPDSSEVRAAITPGHIMRIAAAVKAAKKLRAVADRNRAKRGMSLQPGQESANPSPTMSGDSTATFPTQDSSVLSTTELNMNDLGDELSRQISQPQPTRPGPSTMQDDQNRRLRHASGMSVDDTFLEDVRYVEDELGRPVVERGSDLERPARSGGADVSEGVSPKGEAS